MTHIPLRLSGTLATVLLYSAAMLSVSWAADPVRLTLKDHRFVPAEISVPEGERFRIEVTNQDPTPAEFESSDLRAEKIVTPGTTIRVMAGPLKPGTYAFFDDYHPDQTHGTLIVTARQAKE